MKRNEEYSSLRAEIIGIVDIIQNYIIAMYTITIAILTFAIQQQNQWLFLIPYVVLYSFQRIIAVKKDIMVRMAAYIVVFLDGEFGWEKNYSDICKETTFKHNASEKFSKLKNIVSGRISSLQLGAVCSVGCVIMSIYDIFKNGIVSANILDAINVIDIIPIFCAILLFGALAESCKNSLNAMQRREQYIESLSIYKEKNNNKKPEEERRTRGDYTGKRTK